MTVYLFANNAASTLASAIGAGDTTLTVQTADASEFPSPSSGQAFRLVVESGSKSEWMTCTARSGAQLTVSRGASPQSFPSGATVEHRMDATALGNLRQKADHRTVTSDPDGSLVADYNGEEVYQSATGVWWKHCTGTTWKAMNL